jgi:hypothetical protein
MHSSDKGELHAALIKSRIFADLGLVATSVTINEVQLLSDNRGAG